MFNSYLKKLCKFRKTNQLGNRFDCFDFYVLIYKRYAPDQTLLIALNFDDVIPGPFDIQGGGH